MLALANYSDSDTDDSNPSLEKECPSEKREDTENKKSGTVSLNSTSIKSYFQASNSTNDRDDKQEDIYCSDEEEMSEEMRLRANKNATAVSNFGLSAEKPVSEDESSSEDSDVATEESREKIVDEILDNPFRNSSLDTGDEHVIQDKSVFQIAFREQENKKSAALERHVKMTAMAGAVQMINGKKMCWNHRKGRCRFGHNCTFAHDTDLPTDDPKRKKTNT